ncbi:hypothetical protein D6D17_01815 [Aureobasidium pullulans]|nr:hypothetical protein D6D17_01815 [Aureobasidium pullulans]
MAGILDKSMSYTYVTRMYNIPRGTIAGRINGAQERRDAHVQERKLSKTQGEELAEWILDLDKRHQPPSHQRCRLMALAIQRSAGSDAGLGRKWLYGFFERYPAYGSLWGDPHESSRVNEATEQNVRAWFDFSSDKFRVLDENIHNMDEHGLCIGKTNPKKVVGATKDNWGRPRKRTKMRNSQTREWVSIVDDVLQPLDLVMFSPIERKYKDKLYELCQLNDGDHTRKKDFCHLYYEARLETFKPSNYASAFKKAGLVPFDPESVIRRPEVIRTPTQPTQLEPSTLPPRIYVKALEKDLYHLNQENQAPIEEKLEMTTWVAHKAVEALATKTVELAQHHLRYQTLECRYKELQSKKGRKKVPPKRGRHLIDRDDIIAKQKEWHAANDTPPPTRSIARTRMRK